MKGVLVILDGVGDLPCKQLENKTPLEAAETPNLDFLATRGKLGYMYPVRPGYAPGSDEAIVSIFGNDLLSSTRGQLEARGADVKLVRGDLAFRANFATIDSLEKGNVKDRRGGRTITTAEADSLAKSLSKIKLSCKVEVYATVQHRIVVVFRGGFSDNISGNDTTYSAGKSKQITKIGKCKPFDDDENSVYTANIVNEFLEKAYEILKDHQVNKERTKKGLLPANYILLRNGGIEKPKLKQYKKWVSANYLPLEIGFSKVSGMKNFSFKYPKLKGLDSYKNLWDGLKKACKYSIKVVKKNKRADYVYIHLKETDLPGHDNKPFEKKHMIEHIDKTVFKFLRKFAPPNKIKIVVTADHPTPCKLKEHSADPVPVLLYDDSVPKEKTFCEKECRKGALGRMLGKNFLKKVGFAK